MPNIFASIAASSTVSGAEPELLYGLNNCGAEWNAHAALKEETNSELTPLSRDGLIAQLEYEGFKHQQAEYGV